jgi:hypothetical protein
VKIEFTSEEDERIVGLPEFTPGSPFSAAMTNADHSIDDGLEDALRRGMKGRHAAWNFNGLVWLDDRTGMFCEVVRQYHVIVGAFAAPSLKELMSEVNDCYGWD